jgi:DNA-binding transcriptional MerR regulator
MNIGEAASRSGLPTKTIRYYEGIGLVSSTRRPNGFREYEEREVRKLRFIRCARSLGLTVEECRQLVDLFEDRNRPASEAAALAQAQIEAVHAKIELLRALEAALAAVPAWVGSAGDEDFPSLDVT